MLYPLLFTVSTDCGMEQVECGERLGSHVNGHLVIGIELQLEVVKREVDLLPTALRPVAGGEGRGLLIRRERGERRERERWGDGENKV